MASFRVGRFGLLHMGCQTEAHWLPIKRSSPLVPAAYTALLPLELLFYYGQILLVHVNHPPLALTHLYALFA